MSERMVLGKWGNLPVTSETFSRLWMNRPIMSTVKTREETPALVGNCPGCLECASTVFWKPGKLKIPYVCWVWTKPDDLYDLCIVHQGDCYRKYEALNKQRANGLILSMEWYTLAPASKQAILTLLSTGEWVPPKHVIVPTVAPASLSPSHRFVIFKRDEYRCKMCGVAARDGDHVRLEVDHITPRSKGGSNDPANLWTLCWSCNRGKGVQEL